MNRSYYVVALLTLAVFIVIGSSSCRKSAYGSRYTSTPFTGINKSKRGAYSRESYRGAGYRYDPTTYRTSRAKSKSYRSYKSVRVRPSNYRR